MGYRNSPRPKMTYEIADGGFIDWTQHLLQNKKERECSRPVLVST